MSKKKKTYGESFPEYKGFPVIGVLLSEHNWFKLLPTNTLIKLENGKVRMEKLEVKDDNSEILNKARLERFKLGMSEIEFNDYINYTNLIHDWQFKYKKILEARVKDGKEGICKCGKTYKQHFIDDSYKTCEFIKDGEKDSKS